MARKPFKGSINLDIRDSTADWDAFLADKAPEGAPNVLVVLHDDTGCAAWSPYGGRIHVDEQVVAEAEIRTQASRYSLCGEGLCIGYDGGDAVSGQYTPRYGFRGGKIAKVVFDVADDAYVDVERHIAAAFARD